MMAVRKVLNDGNDVLVLAGNRFQAAHALYENASSVSIATTTTVTTTVTPSPPESRYLQLQFDGGRSWEGMSTFSDLMDDQWCPLTPIARAKAWAYAA